MNAHEIHVRAKLEQFLCSPTPENQEYVESAMRSFTDNWINTRVPKADFDACADKVRAMYASK